jgi:hypothetical protein
MSLLSACNWFKYIRLQSLCQVKIEVIKIHFLRVKKHLTRRTLIKQPEIFLVYGNISVNPIRTQKHLEFIFKVTMIKSINICNTTEAKIVLNLWFQVQILVKIVLKNMEITTVDGNILFYSEKRAL